MEDDDHSLPRDRVYYFIYVSIFGVIWGVGTSILAATLPPELAARALFINWFEVIILLLTKLVVRRPLSVTFAILIASTISIFTFSFGPPNPYKPLFFLAGLAFDAGTLFRTTTLKLWNLAVGFVCFVITISAVFILVITIVDPKAFWTVFYTVPVAMTIYFIEGIIIAPILWYFLRQERAPARVIEVWRQLGIHN